MSQTWRFYRFDYAAYLALRPALRSATTPEAFAAIAEMAEMAEMAETEAIVLALQDGEITIQAAQHEWIITACCPGEALTFDRQFAHFVGKVGRRRGAEEVQETLAELAAGGKNLEAWLLPSFGFAGFLTPEETQRLAKQYAPLAKTGRVPTGQRRRTRRGGLFGWLRGMFHRLIDDGLQMEEMLALLGYLLDEAVQNGEGIAAVIG